MADISPHYARIGVHSTHTAFYAVDVLEKIEGKRKSLAF